MSSTKSGPRRPALTRVQFVCVLFVIAGATSLTASVWVRSRERERDTPAKPDLAQQARAFLRERNVAPLSPELSEAADKNVDRHVETQPHPLLRKIAPEFALQDDLGQTHARNGKPLVLVFYYGYHCNHCVSQLFAVHDDIALFRECGAEVWAISADDPADTRDRLKEYGRFEFPVLSDPENKVAEQFGVFVAARDGKPERQVHGTFLVDARGTVRWCNLGEEPFIDNATLVRELIRLRNETNE